MTDYYELLELPRDADADEIAQRIKEKKRLWVQRQNAPRPEQRIEAEQNLRLIPQVEGTLLNPHRRRAYDHALSPPSSSGRSRNQSAQAGLQLPWVHSPAVWSLVLGLGGLLCSPLSLCFQPFSVAAVVCGHIALRKGGKKAVDPRPEDRRLALVGLVTGYLVILGTVAVFLLAFFLEVAKGVFGS